MRKSLELKEARSKKLQISKELLEKPLDDESRKMLSQLRGEIEQLNADIRELEFVENALVERDTTATTTGVTTTPIGTPGVPTAELDQQVFHRAGKLRAFKKEFDAYASGQWILATIYGNQNAANWCTLNGVKITASLNEGVNTQGGWLVPDVLEQTIIDLRESYGLFRQYAGVYTMGSDHVRIPRRSSGLTAYPVGEKATITDSTNGWNNVELIARKWAVLAKYSSEIAQDAIISIAENLAGEAAYALAKAEDGAGFNGDGTSTYHGITGIVKKFDNQVSAGSSTYTGALDAASGHDTFAEFDITDLTNLMGLLPQYAWGMNPAWYCSQTCWAIVFQKLAAQAGGTTGVQLGSAVEKQFLGYPVRITQSMRTTTGDLSDVTALMFGSLAGAVTFGSRRGLTMATSSERYFETDELAIRVTERFDINVHDIGDTTTAGPMVALIGE